MRITTLPVYSRLASSEDIEAEPQLARKLQEIEQRTGQVWQLSQHQLATYQALRNPDVDIIINTAMTGDGKSLAGLLPLLMDWAESATLALYPTNELIQDQRRSAEAMLPLWGYPADRVTSLFGARLDELVADATLLRRSDLLERELKTYRLVLSNPDILHAILQFCYRQPNRDPTLIAGQIAQLFRQLTFDEFHIFGIDQVVAVLTGLLFLYEQKGPYALKTLFLSATPDGALVHLLGKTGFEQRLCLISPQQQGWYHHGADPGDQWRLILRNTDLVFWSQTAEEWIDAHFDDLLLAWFREHHPHAKAALIVNSVATAHRLQARLEAPFRAAGLTVMTNTGLTGRTARHESYQADLLIGTSTVDVGVDFRINLLIFESLDAGTFLQRLGRLGRHDGFIRNDTFYPFHTFAAHALVPAFVAERLFAASPDGQSAPLAADATITREHLSTLITQVSSNRTTFPHYPRLWGRFQPAKVFKALLEKGVNTTYAEVRTRLKRRYYDLLTCNVSTTLEAWRDYQTNGELAIVDEALAFRGTSSLDCGVLKEGENEPLTYDLLWLLAHVHLEPLELEAFCTAVKRFRMSDTPYRQGRQVAFFRWYGFLEQRRDVTVLLPPAISEWGEERYRTAQVVSGISLDCPDLPWLLDLNRRLRGRKLVGLIVPGMHPAQLRGELYLHGHFPLHRYRDDNNIMGTIAFGRTALLLDSSLRYRKLGGTSHAPLIY